MTAGPISTSISDGKMKKISGNSNFVGIFAAASSARICALRPHGVGLNTQGLRDVGAKAVRLNDHADERGDVVHPRAKRQVAQGLLTPHAGAQLQRHQPQFIGHFLAANAQLGSGAIHGGIQTQPGLHTHRHQVQRIRQRFAQFLLTPARERRTSTTLGR